MTARQRRQRTCGIVSLSGSFTAFVSFLVVGYGHDYGHPQAMMGGVAVCTAAILVAIIAWIAAVD